MGKCGTIIEGVVFRGANNLNLDNKGRMAIPAKYRDRLAEMCDGQLVVTLEDDSCLLVYPISEWERIEKQLVKLSTFDKKMRRLQRMLVGHANEVEMDGSGRVLIPANLREYTGMEKHVVLIGQGHRFELWDESSWNEQRDQWMKEDEDDTELPEALKNFSL